MITKSSFKLILFIILIPIFSVLNSCLCFSQQKFIDNLLMKGERFFEQGNYKESIAQFEIVLTEDKNSIPALIGLAKSFYSQNRFSKARDIIEKALKIDTGNIDLHYYYAIMLRDIGRYNNTVNLINVVFNDKALNKSENYFTQVISKDSLYKDVFYQYSLLLRFNKRYIEAVDLNLRQIQLKPNNPEIYTGLLRNFYAAYKNINHSDLEDYLNKEKSDIKTFLLGELKRLEGEPETALAILRKLSDSTVHVPKSLINLSLLRVYLSCEDKQKFDKYYFSKISESKDSVDFKIIFNDIKYLASPEEIWDFGLLQNKEEFLLYMEAFWNKRNPSPHSGVNSRILEHYERLLFAEKNYKYDRERYSFIENRNSYLLNYEFTDQGFIYIRFGNPDDKSLTAFSSISEKKTLSTDEDDERFKEEAADPYDYRPDYALIESVMTNNKIVNTQTVEYPMCESWLYYPTKDLPKMIFHFLGGEKFLTPIILEKHVLEDIRTWDKQFSDYLWDTDESRVGGSGFTQKAKINRERRLLFGAGVDNRVNEIFETGKKNITTGLSKERSVWNKEMINLDLPSHTYTFRGSDKKSIFELVFLIPTSEIFNKLPKSTDSVDIEISYGIYNKYWNKILSKTDTLGVLRPTKTPDFYLKVFHCEINPDTCGILISYHPIGTNIYGNTRKLTCVPGYFSSGLKISDIEPGVEKPTGHKIFNKNNKILIPKVIPSHNLKTPLAVYYEIYNLKKNLDGKVMYKIEYKIRYTGSQDILKKLLSGGNRESSISTEFFQTGKETSSKEFINLDVKRLVPGKYVLEIKITDQNANQAVMKSADIDLYEKE